MARALARKLLMFASSRLLIAFAASLYVAACGTGTAQSECTPGQSISCVGPGGCTGGQTCNGDGDGYDDCICGTSESDGGSGDGKTGPRQDSGADDGRSIDTGAADTHAPADSSSTAHDTGTKDTAADKTDASCTSAAECLKYYACDMTTHTCTTTCFSGQLCNGGCCDTLSGGNTCVEGLDQLACGGTGAACISCGQSSSGTAWVISNRTCGCAGPSDCPTYGVAEACDTTNGTCTTSCSPSQPCNAGCCDGNVCVEGESDTACGSGGAGIVCADCTKTGQTCQSILISEYSCGT